MALGDYPAEYNPKVHGPYDPARFYGKRKCSNRNIAAGRLCNEILVFSADTPFGQVKISELGAWFGRRNKSPQALMGGLSRTWWRWQHKYVQPKRAGIAPMFQLIAGSMLFFYAINYGKTSEFAAVCIRISD